MIDKTQFSRFSQFGRGTPEATVTATLEKGEKESYRIPGGFRLDAFVASRHPDKNVSVTFVGKKGEAGCGITVKVLDGTGQTVETHEALYDAPQA